jgi:hypothetical protein
LYKAGRLKIEVRTVSDQVHSAVRDRKIPLREALTRLEQDGLVSSLPNRGYVLVLSAAQR